MLKSIKLELEDWEDCDKQRWSEYIPGREQDLRKLSIQFIWDSAFSRLILGYVLLSNHLDILQKQTHKVLSVPFLIL
jgi:hypothetical protein